MTSLTFYGGVKEIGGNKILLKDGDTKIFLDFGLSFKKGKEFYSGFLTARRVCGAKDDLELGVLPRIEGLYSEEELAFTDLKYSEPEFDAIFLTHPHMDHSAHLQYIDPAIPIYCGETTMRVVETFKPGEREAEALGIHKYNYFHTGAKIKVGSVEVEPIHVDHSVPGAYGFIVHTSEGTIVYTGDFRFHGPACKMTHEFFEKAVESRPDALITEGTRLGRIEEKVVSEKKVSEKCKKAISGTKNLALATFSGRDVDRMMTLYKTAKESGRKFVISVATAHLLNKLKDDPKLKVPDPLTDENIKIYFRKKKSGQYDEKDYFIWERPYLQNSISCDWVKQNEGKVLMELDFFNFAELVDLKPGSGSTFIYSMSEPFSEHGMDQIEFSILKNWMRHFKLKMVGAHASGHASPQEIKGIVKAIKPKKIFPIHTEMPEKFKSWSTKTKIVKEGVEYKL